MTSALGAPSNFSGMRIEALDASGDDLQTVGVYDHLHTVFVTFYVWIYFILQELVSGPS